MNWKYSKNPKIKHHIWFILIRFIVMTVYHHNWYFLILKRIFLATLSWLEPRLFKILRIWIWINFISFVMSLTRRLTVSKSFVQLGFHFISTSDIKAFHWSINSICFSDWFQNSNPVTGERAAVSLVLLSNTSECNNGTNISLSDREMDCVPVWCLVIRLPGPLIIWSQDQQQDQLQ